jgi:hypothetical protein
VCQSFGLLCQIAAPVCQLTAGAGRGTRELPAVRCLNRYRPALPHASRERSAEGTAHPQGLNFPALDVPLSMSSAAPLVDPAICSPTGPTDSSDVTVRSQSPASLLSRAAAIAPASAFTPGDRGYRLAWASTGLARLP